jgi:hypothetical protein
VNGVPDFRRRVSYFEFRVSGFGFQVSGFRFLFSVFGIWAHHGKDGKAERDAEHRSRVER